MITGLDHVALPMEHTAEMITFYRALGFTVVERDPVVSVYAGSQMINFHRPHVWRHERFTLRAPAAVPPCGDLCFVWEGTAGALRARLAELDLPIEVGPVEREGARRESATSVYVRDPDGNLVEFLAYDGTGSGHDA